LEARQARVARDAEHDARNQGAIEAETRAIEALNARRGDRIRIGKPEAKPAANKRAAGPAQNKAAPAPTGEVEFASDEAEALAKKLKVGPEQLSELQPSGARGYTVADVKAAAERDEE
jgi:hypothetical protein